MNNQHNALIIQVCIKGFRPDQDVSMELRRLIPFAPTNDTVIELWKEWTEEEPDNTYALQLQNVVYSLQESAFIARIDDEDARSMVWDGAGVLESINSLVSFYTSYRFSRLTYPTAKIIKE